MTHICVSKLTIIGSYDKPLSEPVPEYCYLDTKEQLQGNLNQNLYNFI